jgi:endonuclease/exonuclease/phosphatase family metal-dependent hydrolase
MPGTRNWLSLFAVGLVLSAAGLGCRRPLRRPVEPRGAHFSVLTYNINYGGHRADLSVAAILSTDADIVCLQETSPAWEKYLRPRLKRRYPHCLFRHGRGAGGMAVFSKRALREIAWHKPAAGWFHGWVLRADTPVGPVQILSVHLRPPLSDRGRPGLGAMRRTRAIRLAEVTELGKQLDPAMPRIVLGDFNEEDQGKAVQHFVKQLYADALAEFDRKSDTWHWRAGPLLLNRRFDHILYSPKLHCCRAQVIKAGASDHLPVFALFDKRLERGNRRP